MCMVLRITCYASMNAGGACSPMSGLRVFSGPKGMYTAGLREYTGPKGKLQILSDPFVRRSAGGA